MVDTQIQFVVLVSYELSVVSLEEQIIPSVAVCFTTSWLSPVWYYGATLNYVVGPSV